MRLVLASVLSILVVASGLAAADPVTAYLQGLHHIRVLVVESPNYGHQMTAVAWLQRLRELGYAGKLEVVTEGQSSRKLQALLPNIDLKSNPFFSVVSLNDLKSALQEGKAPLVDLAIVPAEDWYDSSSMIRMQAPGRPVNKNILGARNILRMQPSGWKDGKRNIERADGKIQSLEDIGLLALRLPQSLRPTGRSTEDVKRWLQEISFAYSEQSATRIAEMILDNGVDQFPFYCAHTEKVVYLSRLALASARSGSDKPIRIWVTSEFSDFQWLNLSRSLKRNTHNSETFILKDLNSFTTEKIGSAEFHVEIVRLPTTPPALVRYLAETATLPPAVTGKYSQNIMFQMGRPFLELKFFDEIQEALQLTEPVLSVAQAVTREINESISTAAPVAIDASLFQFWKMVGHSDAVKQYGVKRVVSPDQDLVYASLDRLARFITCESDFTDDL